MDKFLRDLFILLYKNQFIQTLWNAEKEENRKNGWGLVSGVIVPWYFNMRPVGGVPDVFNAICALMTDMIMQKDVDLIVGVEMAGVPLAGAICAHAMLKHQKSLRFGYTRSLPGGAKTPDEVVETLSRIKGGHFTHGQKDYVEGRINMEDRVAIVDDMSTTLGSKIAARAILLWEAKKRGVDVTCNKIFYFLDRGKDNIQAGLEFADEKDERLNPEALEVNYVISFDKYLPALREVMRPDEYEAILEHQQNPKRFHRDVEWRSKLVASANK